MRRRINPPITKNFYGGISSIAGYPRATKEAKSCRNNQKWVCTEAKLASVFMASSYLQGPVQNWMKKSPFCEAMCADVVKTHGIIILFSHSLSPLFKSAVPLLNRKILDGHHRKVFDIFLSCLSTKALEENPQK